MPITQELILRLTKCAFKNILVSSIKDLIVNCKQSSGVVHEIQTRKPFKVSFQYYEVGTKKYARFDTTNYGIKLVYGIKYLGISFGKTTTCANADLRSLH